MKEEFLKQIAQEKYHDSIRYRAHRKTGADRRNFILEISEYSLFLAAKTATTCAKDEVVLEAIYQKALNAGETAKTQKSVSVDAVLCLVVLKKFVDAVFLFNPQDEDTKNYRDVNLFNLAELEQEGAVNATIFAMLIALSSDYAMALSFYDAIQKMNIEANISVYGNLIAISPDYETALFWYQKSQNENLSLDINVYGNLIGKSPDYATALSWYKQAQMDNLSYMINVYGNLIVQSPDYKTALSWYLQAQMDNLSPDINVYGSLIGKSPDYVTALYWYKQSQKDNLNPNIAVYSNLIGKSHDYVTALYWYKQCQKDNLSPVINVYGNLIAQSPDYITALYWYQQAQKDNLNPIINVYSNLIVQARYIQNPKQRYEVAKRYFDKAISLEEEKDIYIYKFMIKFSLNYSQAQFYFQAMEKAGFQADAEAFEFLLSKANFLEKKKLALEMQKRGF